MTAAFAAFFAPVAAWNGASLRHRLIEALCAPDASGLVFPVASGAPREPQGDQSEPSRGGRGTARGLVPFMA